MNLDAGPEVRKPGPPQGLLGEIEDEVSASFFGPFSGLLSGPFSGNGEAGARNAHAVSLPRFPTIGKGDPDPQPFSARQDPTHGGTGFYEAGEHGDSSGEDPKKAPILDARGGPFYPSLPF
jgi:hypothetical protein